MAALVALRPRRRTLVLGAALALAALTGVAGPELARACGTFRARAVSPEALPTPSREKVLLIHDAAASREHFVREIAFRHQHAPFGFVVPTPTRPEVAAVEDSPFSALRERFPFAPVARSYGAGAKSASASGVEVLETKKVGSFTAFVLSATDSAALGQWLTDNDLVRSPESKAWLEHYVRMGFFYVAMRYDPSPGGSLSGGAGVEASKHAKQGRMSAEVMRISFDTPVPYYPYLEPARPPELSVQQEREGGRRTRLLELWVVGTREVVPVALEQGGGGSGRWVRPLEPGVRTSTARGALEQVLDGPLAALMPPGELVLQTFQDQKNSRDGFGDILFAPLHPRALDEGQREALAPMLGVLDPGLIPAPANADSPAGAGGAP